MWTEKKAACKRAGFWCLSFHLTDFLLLTSCACSHACHACFFGRTRLTSRSKKNWQGEKARVKKTRPHWEPRRVQHICDFEVIRGQTANIPQATVRQKEIAFAMSRSSVNLPPGHYRMDRAFLMVLARCCLHSAMEQQTNFRVANAQATVAADVHELMD